MSTTYAKSQTTAQKKDASSASSVLDSSSQSESLQRKADMANNAAQRAEAPRPNNTGMPDNLKSGIESLSGFSMDDVRVHYNSSKPATVQALAYTQGTDIHVAPGQEKHLPHEAWHVAQQMAGRVSPTTNINGMPVNDNAGLEHEADVMGEKAVQCKMIGINFTKGKVQNTAVQRMAFYNGSVVNTKQFEGKPLFGRQTGEARSDSLALLVDLYKKEMLTYIASLIQNIPIAKYGKTWDFGPHISVIITGGIWYIAINATIAVGDSPLDDEKWNNLSISSSEAKKVIQKEFNTIKSKYEKKIPLGITDRNIENYGSFSEKEQAMYIAYRWAAKEGDVVVTNTKMTDYRQQGTPKSAASVSGLGKMSEHGEMHSIGKLQNQELGWWNNGRIEEMVTTRLKNFHGVDNSALENIKSFLTQEGTLLDSYMQNVDVLKFIRGDEDGTLKALVAVYKSEKDFENRIKAHFKAELNTDIRKVIDEIICQIFIRKLKERVVRVGGSKTPCNGCANEMMSQSCDHNTIKERKIVLMSNKSGSGYKDWGIPGVVVTAKPENDFVNPGDKGYKRGDKRGDDEVVVTGFDLNQDLHYLNLFGEFASLTGSAAAASPAAPAAAAAAASPAAPAAAAAAASLATPAAAENIPKYVVVAFEKCKKIEDDLTSVENSIPAAIKSWRELSEDEIKKSPVSGGDENVQLKLDLGGKIEEVKNEVFQVQKLVKGCIDKKIESLEEKKKTYESYVIPLLERIKGINDEKKELESGVKKIFPIRGDCMRQIKAKQQKIDEIQQEIEAINQGFEAKQQEIEAKQQEIDELQQEIDEIQQEIKAKQQEIEAINQEIKAKQQDIEAKQQKIDELQQKIDGIKTKNPNLENDCHLCGTLNKINKDDFVFEGSPKLSAYMTGFETVFRPQNADFGPGVWFYTKGIVYEFERILCKCVSVIKTLQMIDEVSVNQTVSSSVV